MLGQWWEEGKCEEYARKKLGICWSPQIDEHVFRTCSKPTDFFATTCQSSWIISENLRKFVGFRIQKDASKYFQDDVSSKKSRRIATFLWPGGVLYRKTSVFHRATIKTYPKWQSKVAEKLPEVNRTINNLEIDRLESENHRIDVYK